MPHILHVVDSGHLEGMKAVVRASEECLHGEGEQSAHQGEDYVVNVWIGLSGPAVLAGGLFRYFEVYLALYTEALSYYLLLSFLQLVAES